MKKVFFIAVMAVAYTAMMSAQDNQVKKSWNELKSEVKTSTPRAIGANLGGFVGFSYQQSLKSGANMLDLAASFVPLGSLGVAVQGTYDWINPFNTSIPWDKKGEWNWAMGVGLGGGVVFAENLFGGHVGVAGHVGIAYDFWFPLELSIDWRPEIGPSMYTQDGKFNAGFYLGGLCGCTLGVRYLF